MKDKRWFVHKGTNEYRSQLSLDEVQQVGAASLKVRVVKLSELRISDRLDGSSDRVNRGTLIGEMLF
jgi:hypothetical protein